MTSTAFKWHCGDVLPRLKEFWRRLSELCIWPCHFPVVRAPKAMRAHFSRMAPTVPRSSAIELSTLFELSAPELEEAEWDEVSTRDADEAQLGAPFTTQPSWTDWFHM